MPTIQIREVPEHIYDALRELAQRERRSLAQQTLITLEQGLSAQTDAKQRRLEALARIKERGPIRILDPVASIREDRKR